MTGQNEKRREGGYSTTRKERERNGIWRNFEVDTALVLTEVKRWETKGDETERLLMCCEDERAVG